MLQRLDLYRQKVRLFGRRNKAEVVVSGFATILSISDTVGTAPQLHMSNHFVCVDKHVAAPLLRTYNSWFNLFVVPKKHLYWKPSIATDFETIL